MSDGLGLIMKILITLLILMQPAFAGYLFPVESPIKNNGKIVCTAWYTRIRTENGRSYSYKALNYPAPYGSKILAPEDGVITKHEIQGYEGASLTIKLDDGVEITICHLHQYEKIKGRVKRGEVIGYVGTSGRTTGPHLRIVFEKNGERFFVGAATFGMKVADFYFPPGESNLSMASMYK